MATPDEVKTAPVVLTFRDGKMILLSTIPLEQALEIPPVAQAFKHCDGFVYEPVGKTKDARTSAEKWLQEFVSNLYHNGISLAAIDFAEVAEKMLKEVAWAR